jgi:leucyl-tRNA synthetase
VAWLGERGGARKKVNFKLRDWLISRQRYWGAPIPIVHCDACGPVPVPVDQLPVLLPDLEAFHPTDDGRSPLARDEEFVHTTCPKCGGPGSRETDTMDTFACSSWYHFRFASPHDEAAAFDREKVEYWLPVDLYVGGAEHAVMHLLYARFFCKVAQDADYVSFGEPYARLRNQGMIQAEDGQKMSKSKGNVVTPDSVVERYGADSLRVYELFIAPFEQSVAWSDRGVQGCLRFLSRFWNLVAEVVEAQGSGVAADEAEAEKGRQVLRTLNKTIRKVMHDLETFRFNTAVSALMELQNEVLEVWAGARGALTLAQWREVVTDMTLLVAPMAPHIAEEVWELLGHAETVLDAAWPAWDEELAADEVVTVVVQVNGKLRDRLEVPVDAEKDGVLAQARSAANAVRFLEGKQVVKEIYVPGKLVNFVVR